MAKKNEPGMAYDMKKLNKIFAFLSILFLITVVWVFLDDFMRPWKAVQIKALKVKREKLLKDLKVTNQNIDLEKLEKLEKELEEARAVVAKRDDEINKVKEKLDVVGKDLKAETIRNGQLNAQVSAWKYKAETALAKHKPEAEEYFEILEKYKREFSESNNNKKALDSQKKSLNRKLNSLQKEVLSTQKEIDRLTKTRDLLVQAADKTKMDAIWALRNAPFVDYLDPTLKIQQVVLDNITDDRYFQHVPKVDRCMTCHTFIDQKGYEDQPNPYKTHPKLDLMVGRDSPHPMKSYGCTTCHGGEGHRVLDFNAAAHTPENEEQAAEWREKYSWHEPHKVPKPMFKLSETEAGCVKCHQGVQYIPKATVLNEGRRNIDRFGCYACHKIKGWEHKTRPGPSLQKVASKIDKEFFKNWVWDPKGFNPNANMPSFFHQTNNSNPEFVKKNIAEVNAIAEYVWNKSDSYKPFMKYRKGNANRGKELIESVGCMGCHGVEGIPEKSKKVDAYKGPYLTGLGSKLDPDWLVSWLKKPSHYQEDTIMPSFRLTDSEANDIATYLLSLKNETFEELEFEPLNKKTRDEILMTYFTAFDTEAVAQAKLDKMTDREKTLELGERSIGKYGCYSCHNIDGFAGRSPIGPELTTVGSKPLNQFGFGHDHSVEHSRSGWIYAHLLNPRRWDEGVDKPFKDILRMPNFYMTEEQSKSITVALLGQVSDRVPLRGKKRFDANEAIAAEGMKVVHKFNCVGCHQIDGSGGDILNMYTDDINAGPPRLVEQGHRVKAEWFHEFLDNVYPIRPWLEVRMPSFNMTNDEKNKIVQMFMAKAHQVPFTKDREIAWEPGEKEAAEKLFNSLDCASCHTAGFNNFEPTAPNLHYAKERLRYTWVKKWLADPQAILEGTTMPSFWEGGESFYPEILDGDVEKQIDAITKYLWYIGKDTIPPMEGK